MCMHMKPVPLKIPAISWCHFRPQAERSAQSRSVKQQPLIIMAGNQIISANPRWCIFHSLQSGEPIYSEQELKEIRKVCDEYEMYLFVDGARLGYGLGSVKNDLTLEKLAELTDVFYIGGTKCGALFGEALVITNKKLARKFRTYMKQNGAVLAKGWLLGMQFCALLEDDTYEKMTAQADAYALEIKAAFKEKGIREYVDSYTNQLFVILTEEPGRGTGKRIYL